MTKARKILIINGNPARKRHSLCAALSDAYGEGAHEAGAEIVRIDLKDLNFDPILHEGYEEDQTLEPDLQRARDALVACDHMVFVFPLWHAMPPALFKGFVERTITRGFAFEYKNNQWPTPTAVFLGKSAEIIITCGMPAFVYRWFSGAHASKALATILKMCGIKVSRVKVFGLISPGNDKANTRYAGYVAEAKKLGLLQKT
jgi:NAD(P)H dehydrogenase (quinone)